MASVKEAVGTLTTFANATGLNSAAAGAYVGLGVIDNTTDLYLDYAITVTVTPSATPSGNAQIVILAASSFDNVTYSDTTQDANMALLGTIQMSAAQAYPSRALSVLAGFGLAGLPPYVKILAKIDDGVALAASGNSAQYQGQYQTVA